MAQTMEERKQEAHDFIESRCTKRGDQAALARKFGLRPQDLNGWKRRGIPYRFKVQYPNLFK